MFKKFSYSMAVFCMVCSSMISSLHAECPCKKHKPKKNITTQELVIVDQSQSAQQEITH